MEKMNTEKTWEKPELTVIPAGETVETVLRVSGGTPPPPSPIGQP